MGIIMLAYLEGVYRFAKPLLFLRGKNGGGGGEFLDEGEGVRVLDAEDVSDAEPEPMGWLDYRVEGLEGIVDMAPQLDGLRKDLAWIGSRFRTHTASLLKVKGDPRDVQRIMDKAANDMTRLSKKLERKVPDLCENERKVATLFLHLVERLETGEEEDDGMEEFGGVVQELCTGGLITMITGTSDLLSSTNNFSRQGPTGGVMEAGTRMERGLMNLILGAGMLLECGQAFIDALGVREEE